MEWPYVDTGVKIMAWYEAKYELTATFESESMDDALEYADDIPIPLDGEYTVQEMTLVHILEMD